VNDTVEVKVPDIGDFTDIPVIEVLVSVGDRVNAEDSLITLESDKATMEVPSPQTGVIREVRLKVGDTASAGTVVAVLEVTPADGVTVAVPAADQDLPPVEPPVTEPKVDAPAPPVPAEAQPAEARAPEFPSEPASAPAGQASGPHGAGAPVSESIPRGAAALDPLTVPYASPAVRQFARELGADLRQVKGSGSGGRILHEDVTAFVKSIMTRPMAAAPASAPAPAASLGFNWPAPLKVDFSRFGKVTQQPLSRIRKLAAGHLHRNWVGIPHVTQHDDADITDMEAFRQSQAASAEAQGFKLTPLVFLIKASVAALKKFPQFNASLDPSGEALIMKSYYNIGIAVDTPEGLVVPVLRDCERKGIMELAKELAEVSGRAREQKLNPQDIQGGCFSISSLGGIGGTAFTPIINAPEVAILGVSRSRMQAVWDGKAFQPRLLLPLSLSYDHRVIDGAAGARFTRFLASQLEDLRLLTL